MRILVVDDEAPIRELIKVNLKNSGYDVSEARDGFDALDRVRMESIDLILLDIMLPGVDGLEVCRRLKLDAETARIPIIMITAKAEEVDRIIGLELGADDYVIKPFSVRELIARIRAVLRRGQVPKQHTLEIGGLHLDFTAYTVSVGDKRLSLTPKEYELLKLLVTSPDKAFSREELLSRVWGAEYYGDTRTVDVHVRHLRSKLSQISETVCDELETVRGIGYRFTEKV